MDSKLKSHQLKVILYNDYPSCALSLDVLCDFLANFGFSTLRRNNLFKFIEPTDEKLYMIATKLARCIVQDIAIPLDKFVDINDHQINKEIDRISGKNSDLKTFYDGLWVQRIFHEFLALKVSQEFRDEYIHIIFTNRLFGTFETKRYHARILLMGTPSLISTSGLVEAPARPREYYYIKGGLVHSGKDTRELDELYKGRFVEYDDPKTSKILCSYVLQAIFYRLTGKEFCQNPSCCLFNSHWQEEVLNIQYKAELCEGCFNLLEQY